MAHWCRRRTSNSRHRLRGRWAANQWLRGGQGSGGGGGRAMQVAEGERMARHVAAQGRGSTDGGACEERAWAHMSAPKNGETIPYAPLKNAPLKKKGGKFQFTHSNFHQNSDFNLNFKTG